MLSHMLRLSFSACRAEVTWPASMSNINAVITVTHLKECAATAPAQRHGLRLCPAMLNVTASIRCLLTDVALDSKAVGTDEQQTLCMLVDRNGCSLGLKPAGVVLLSALSNTDMPVRLCSSSTGLQLHTCNCT